MHIQFSKVIPLLAQVGLPQKRGGKEKPPFWQLYPVYCSLSISQLEGIRIVSNVRYSGSV
jgi:hypothetical protein